MKYRIKAGATGYTIQNARSKKDALKQWLDSQSYETIGQAAREHFCKPEDITVSRYFLFADIFTQQTRRTRHR